MKTNIISLAFISLLFLSSCKHETIYPTHPQPNWQVVSDVDMRYSMTIVGALPEHLIADADTADLIGAFVVTHSEGSDYSEYSDNSDTLCCGLTRLTAIPLNSPSPSGEGAGGGVEAGTSSSFRAFLYITLPTGVDDDCRIILRYYATRTRYLYQSEAALPFQSDAIIGNISDPYEFPFGEPQ
ncbi:MAG: hypothetical protein ACI30J_09440 [Paludibacteraceae bacterium]